MLARDLGDCLDGCPGPLTPYVGDSRREQNVAAERPTANISTVYEVNYVVMTTIQLENYLREHCA